MKKNKAIVFALLGVLSVSAITAGAFYGTTNHGLHANATITSDCSLTWNNANRPILKEDGTGTSVSSHIIMKYSGAKAAPLGDHVTLDIGGQVLNDYFTKWSDATQRGGVIHGVERIVVRFKDNSAGKAKLILNAKHEYTPIQDAVPVTSGVAIDFSGTQSLPNRLTFTWTGTAGDGTCDIESIEIGATAKVRNEVRIDSPENLVKAYHISNDSLGREVVRASNFGKGEIFALKVKDGRREILNKDKITVSNGSVDTRVIGGVETVVVVANPTTDNADIKVKVTGYDYPVTHATGNFLGKYKLFNLSKGSVMDLDIANTARYSYNGKQGDYTVTFADEADPNSFTVAFNYNNRDVTLRRLDNGFIVMGELVRSGNSARTIYHLGFKDNVTVNKCGSSGETVFAGTLTNGEVSQKVVIHDSKLFIDGVDGITINAYPEPTVALADGKDVCVTETVQPGQETLLETLYENNEFTITETEGVSKEVSVVFETSNNPSPRRVGKERNVYTNVGEKTTTLALDGYGFYILTVNGEATKGAYTLNDNEVTLADGKVYIVDPAKVTFREPTPAPLTDPYATTAGKYYDSTNYVYYLFHNGKLDVLPTTTSAAENFALAKDIAYTYEKGVIKATIPGYKWTSTEYIGSGWEAEEVVTKHTSDIPLELTWKEGNLVSTKTIKVTDQGKSKDVITKDKIFEIPTDPFAGQTLVFKFTNAVNPEITYTLTIADNMATITSTDPDMVDAYKTLSVYYLNTKKGISVSLRNASESSDSTIEFNLDENGNMVTNTGFFNKSGQLIHGCPAKSVFVKQA